MAASSFFAPSVEIFQQSILNIADIISKFRDATGNSLLTNEEAVKLASIKRLDGNLLFDLNEKHLIYQIVLQIPNYSVKEVYDNLDIDRENLKDAFFNSLGMQTPKNKYEITKRLITNKTEMDIDGISCARPGCSSNNTVTIGEQTTSADEGQTLKHQCLTCNYRWSEK